MGLGGVTGTIRGQLKAAVAPPSTTRFPWQDPMPQRAAEVKKHTFACFSLLGLAHSSLIRTSFPNTFLRPPSEYFECSREADSLRAPMKTKIENDFFEITDIARCF